MHFVGALLLLVAVTAPAQPTSPYAPASDAAVLQKVPPASDPAMRRIAALRRAVAAKGSSAADADALARAYVDYGRKVGDAFDPARDEAAGEQCKAYGAANVMRLPGRLRVSWADDTTLKVETDAGTQTRLLRFGAGAPSGEPSWQGWSAAEWVNAGRRGDVRVGTLKVVTTNLRPGYIRKNGAPYSDKTKVTEYFDLNTAPNGDRWLTVTTKVEDPEYFARYYLTTSEFKKLPGAAGWNPTPCSAR
jgi:hypothetical protein